MFKTNMITQLKLINLFISAIVLKTISKSKNKNCSYNFKCNDCGCEFDIEDYLFEGNCLFCGNVFNNYCKGVIY